MSAISDDVKRMAAATALRAMVESGRFSICTVDSIGDLFGVKPGGEAYKVLRSVHCVGFAEMPEDLRNEIPALIRLSLQGVMNLEAIFEEQKPAPATARKLLVRRLRWL